MTKHVQQTGVSHASPWDLQSGDPPIVKQAVKDLAGHIFERVAAGHYSFGTRLPAERELSLEFAVSRNTVRQALEFLETYKVIARRVGSGAFVSLRLAPRATLATNDAGMINVTEVSESISPFEMNVAQSIIEPEIARLATISMSIRDLTNMREILTELGEVTADADRFSHLEKQFMMTLCEGTRNAAIIAMYRVINEVRKQPQWCADRKRSLTPQRIRQAQQALRSLFTALERRNVDNAVECVRLYIASSQEDMIYSSA